MSSRRTFGADDAGGPQEDHFSASRAGAPRWSMSRRTKLGGKRKTRGSSMLSSGNREMKGGQGEREGQSRVYALLGGGGGRGGNSADGPRTLGAASAGVCR